MKYLGLARSDKVCIGSIYREHYKTDYINQQGLSKWINI